MRLDHLLSKEKSKGWFILEFSMRTAWGKKIEQKPSLLEFLRKVFEPDRTNVLSHERSECRAVQGRTV